MLTPDAYGKLAADGLDPIEPPPVHHVGTYYPVVAQIIEAGGLACDWGRPQTDIRLTLAQLSDADMHVWEAALTEGGFVETGDPVPGAYTGPVDSGSGISPVVVVAGDTLTFISAPTFAAWISPTS